MAEKKLKLKPALLGILIVILSLYLINTNFLRDQELAEDEYEEELIPEYEIVEIEEAHLPEAKRYEYHVVVKEEVKEESLRHTSYLLLEKAKEELEFNGVAFSYYDREEYVGRAQETLGQALYAPFGNPGRVDEVPAGNYETMEFSWSLRSKDWDQQLSDRDVEIWTKWHDLHQNLQEKLQRDENLEKKFLRSENDLTAIDKDAVSAEIASRFDIEPDKVESIREEFGDWLSMDLGS